MLFKTENKNKKTVFTVDPGIIIDRPSLVTKTRKFSEFTIGVIGWILWFFLVRPLFIFIVWYVTYRFFEFQMFNLRGIDNPAYYAYGFAVVMGIFSLMVFWNRYNVYRFRNKEKRRSRGEADDVSMAAFYQLEPEDVGKIKEAPYIEFYYPESDVLEIAPDGSETRLKAHYDPQKNEIKLNIIRQKRGW